MLRALFRARRRASSTTRLRPHLPPAPSPFRARPSRARARAGAQLCLELHFLAMFAPGFVTGRLIARVGAARVSLAGVACFGGAAATLLLGHSMAHFVGGMSLVGLAWNLCFSSGTVRCARAFSSRFSRAFRIAARR